MWMPVANACVVPQVGYIDDRFGPLGLAAVVVLALTAILIISVVDFVDQLHRDRPAAAPPPLLSQAASLLTQQRPSLRSQPFGDVALQRSM
jgi:hypothetical protein